MLNDQITSLLIALTPNATQKQYLAFSRFERGLTFEQKIENRQALNILFEHFENCAKHNTEAAIARQQKREYQLQIAAKTIKTEKFYKNPTICPNKKEFACAGCSKISNPTYAPMHKTSEGWRLYCADCGIPPAFKQIVKEKSKLYQTYVDWQSSLSPVLSNDET